MERPGYLSRITFSFEVHPVVALLGPRQCGKTTLAKMYTEQYSDGEVIRFDLEDPTDLARLENPKLALEELSGLIIIDEIQRAPNLFDVLRVLVDQPSNQRRFLILGSASRELIRQSSESLAGRIGYIELRPFDISEVGLDRQKNLWLNGGYPRSFLARSTAISLEWRKSYISTFLERDIPSLGINIASTALRRFWLMLAHYHGQTVNYSELGRSFGASDKTIRHYLDILSSTFMVRQLPPWFENIKKRQVKSPKIYIRDSGIYHSLLGISDIRDLRTHPKLGASWEGFVIEELIRRYNAQTGECYFWSVYGRAELDLLMIMDGKRIGFEVKYTDKPELTHSVKVAQQDLQLDELYILYPGQESFPLGNNARAQGFSDPQFHFSVTGV